MLAKQNDTLDYANKTMNRFFSTREERLQYEAAFRYECDRASLLEEGQRLGMEKGLELGLEQGIELGQQQGLEQGIELGQQQGLEQGIELGQQQGLEQGIELGQQQGLEQGLEQDKIEVARNLLGMGISIPDICSATGLSEEVILRL